MKRILLAALALALLPFAVLAQKPGLHSMGPTTSAQLRSVITDETGTGLAYFQGGDLGAPSAGVLTNATGLPLTTGVTGILGAANGGTGVANNAAATLIRSGNHALTITTTGTTGVTFPTAGTLAILGANTFTAGQTIAYGGASSTFDYSASAIGTTGELVLSGTRSLLNTLVLQNLASDGYSAATMRDNTGRERTTFGYGNSGASGTFAGYSYWEGWNGKSFNGSIDPPTGQRMVQTGYNTYFDPATSTASTASGTVLTIGGSLTGTFKVNQTLSGAGITAGTRIVSLGTGTGGAGTYNISASHSIAVAQAINAAGQDTQEVKIDVTNDGYIKMNRWADHSTNAFILDPKGHLDLFSNTATGANAVSIKNEKVDAYSTVQFLDSSGVEKIVVGYGNASAGSFTSAAFMALAASTTLQVTQGGTERWRMTTSGGLAVGLTTDTAAGAIRASGAGIFGGALTGTSLNVGSGSVVAGDVTASNNIGAAGVIYFSGTKTALRAGTDGLLRVTKDNNTVGTTLDFTTVDTLRVKNLANNADGAFIAGTGAFTGALTSTASVGYAAGAGGTVTQLTDKSTTAVLSKSTGQVTMNSATLNAGVAVTFTLTNTTVAATDIVLCQHLSAGTAGAYTVTCQAAAGSVAITVRNVTAGNLGEAIVIQFGVFKSVTA